MAFTDKLSEAYIKKLTMSNKDIDELCSARNIKIHDFYEVSPKLYAHRCSIDTSFFYILSPKKGQVREYITVNKKNKSRELTTLAKPVLAMFQSMYKEPPALIIDDKDTIYLSINCYGDIYTDYKHKHEKTVETKFFPVFSGSIIPSNEDIVDICEKTEQQYNSHLQILNEELKKHIFELISMKKDERHKFIILGETLRLLQKYK